MSTILAVACGGGGNAATSPSPPASGPAAASPSVTARPDLATLSAAELTAKAKAALRDAKTFHGAGSQVYGDKPVIHDLRFGRTGTTGSVTVGSNRIQVITIGTTSYWKGPDSFWRARYDKREADRLLAVISGKWLKGRTSDPYFREMAGLLERDRLVANLTDVWPPHFTKAGERTVDGVACLGLKAGGSQLWVSKYDARPVRLEPIRGGTLPWFRFSEYDSVPEPIAPPTSMTIDLDKLE